VLSTALSLLLVPAFYVVADRLKGKKAPAVEPPTHAPEHAQ
jgi:hypothetical protein